MINKILIFAFLLTSCTKFIQENEVVCLNGKYYKIGQKKPYSGKVIYKFSNGEISGENEFNNGVPIQAISFGFDGEVITKSTLVNLNYPKLTKNGVDRIVLVKSKEGSDFFYSVKIIILLSKFNEASSVEICDETYKEIRKQYLQRSFDTLSENKKIVFDVSEGEFEVPLYRKTYNLY